MGIVYKPEPHRCYMIDWTAGLHVYDLVECLRMDVYESSAENESARVGSFYDMQFLLFKRFGFSDAHDRIWFEARYYSTLSRFKPVHEYTLERCDGRGGTFDVLEDFWSRSWLCFFNCKQSFTLSRRDGKNGQT